MDRPTRPRAAVAARRERGRRRVVALVFAVYGLMIAEGALRKWLLPEYSQWLFFVRDPFVVAAYALAWRYGLWPRRGEPGWAALQATAAFALLLALWVPLQAATGAPSDWRWLLGGYGWRNYVLLVPLAFLVGATFQPAELQRLARFTLWLLPPVAVLVVMQFHAAPGSAINVGAAADSALQFRGAAQTGEHTRPMGLFASVAGQQQFVASALALWLAVLIAPTRPRHTGVWLWLPAGVALVACVAYSGSRGTVLQCALVAGAAVLLAMVARQRRLQTRAAVGPLLAAGAALLIAPWLAAEGLAALGERWATAAAVEARTPLGIVGRALYGFVDFTRLIGEVPLLGHGLGFGGNASVTLKATLDGVTPGLLAETDFARHMVDLGPILGGAFIALRLLLAGWLAAWVWRLLRRGSGSPWPMLLFAFAGYLLLLGQITGQGAINGYAWLFTGLLIAACRHAEAALPSGRRAAAGLQWAGPRAAA